MSTDAGDPPREQEGPDAEAPAKRPWDDIEVPEVEEVAARRAASGGTREPPRPRRRRNPFPLVASALVLGAVGFLVWYFAFRSGGDEPATPASGATLAPGSLDFGDQDVGRRSPPQTVTLANAGSRPLGIDSIRLTGRHRRSFSVGAATTCEPVAPLNEAESCTIAIRFRPTGRGERVAALEVAVSGRERPLRVALAGTGVGEPEVTLETTRIDLGEVELGGDPASGQVTLTNGGNVPLRIQAIELEGTGAGDFAVLEGRRRCSASRPVRPGASCRLAVRFSPTAVGERAATLVVRHDAAGSPSQIGVRGVGVGVPGATVTPRELAFGGVRVNRRSAPETVTFENTGTAALRLSAVAIAGGGARHFRISGGTCEGGLRLRPEETCTVRVRFRPRSQGRHTATLAFQANTPAGRHTVELRGRGTRAGG